MHMCAAFEHASSRDNVSAVNTTYFALIMYEQYDCVFKFVDLYICTLIRIGA